MKSLFWLHPTAEPYIRPFRGTAVLVIQSTLIGHADCGSRFSLCTELARRALTYNHVAAPRSGRKVGTGGDSTRAWIVEKIEDLKVFELIRRRGVRC